MHRPGSGKPGTDATFRTSFGLPLAGCFWEELKMKLFGLCTLAAFVASISCLASWATHAADVTLSGSAFYRERIALPDHAALVVELIDLSRPETVLDETRVEPSGQVPIAFGLVVDAGKFAAGQTYGPRRASRSMARPGLRATSPCGQSRKGGEPVSLLLLRVDDKAAMMPRALRWWAPPGGVGAGRQGRGPCRDLDACL